MAPMVPGPWAAERSATGCTRRPGDDASACGQGGGILASGGSERTARSCVLPVAACPVAATGPQLSTRSRNWTRGANGRGGSWGTRRAGERFHRHAAPPRSTGPDARAERTPPRSRKMLRGGAARGRIPRVVRAGPGGASTSGRHDQALRLGARAVETGAGVGPVDHVPPRLDVVALDVLVLQVEGVLPHVQHDDRDDAGADVVVLVLELLEHEVPADLVVGEHRPAGALDAGGDVQIGRAS